MPLVMESQSVDAVISELVSVGQRGIPAIPAILSREPPYSLFAQIPVWVQESNPPWSREQLVDLLKGLVLYGIASRVTHGSVSPVIPLFRLFVERFPDSEREMADWIRANRINDYEPFGSQKFSNAKTFAELHDMHWKHEFAVAQKVRMQRELHRPGVIAKATERLPNAVRRGDVAAVEALIERGADWQAAVRQHGSLVKLAEDNNRARMVDMLRERGIG